MLIFPRVYYHFCVESVTTGTYNFVSAILNVAFSEASILSLAFTGGLTLGLAFLAAFVVISVKTQFSDKVKARDTWQFIKSMSKVLQKLLKCFNGTTISRLFLVFVFSCSVFSPFSLFVFDVLSVILLLYLKDSEFVMGSAL